MLNTRDHICLFSNSNRALAEQRPVMPVAERASMSEAPQGIMMAVPPTIIGLNIRTPHNPMRAPTRSRMHCATLFHQSRPLYIVAEGVKPQI